MASRVGRLVFSEKMMCTRFLLRIKSKGASMEKHLEAMIRTTHEFLETANKMMDSCRKKENKRCSDSRLVIAFFCRRAVEITESFLILIKENKLPDALVLLRSFWEMGINTDYIYSAEEKREINSLKYLLNEYRSTIKILEKNQEEFRADGLDVDARLAEIQGDEASAKKRSAEEHGGEDMSWPYISDRAKNSKSWVIKQAYNMAYAYACNIEHHDISFGKDYLDVGRCEPLKEISTPMLLRPDVNLFMCRGILLVIMKTFNDEFDLKWGKVLERFEIIQDDEYKKMKERDGKHD
jgi:hypothetical protein